MDRTALLHQAVTDMAAVEQHILDAVDRQLASDATSRFPEAFRELTTLQTALRRHVESLEAYNDGAKGGGALEAAEEALASVIGTAAGLYNQVRQTDNVSRMVRDTYTATGLAAISYHMLHTTALGLQEPRLAQLAITNLKDLTPILVELSKVVCRVVAHELDDEDRVFTVSIAAEAVRNTQEAWRAEAVS